jgi:uncharacterized DUF497 family protein
MAETISELVATEVALEKLGARGISFTEVQQLVDNRYAVMRRGRRARRGIGSIPARRLLVGRTNGGRFLTLVVERTLEPTTWLVITGWDATAPERRILDT